MKNIYKIYGLVGALVGSQVLMAQTVVKVGASQAYATIQAAYDQAIPVVVDQSYVIELQADYDAAGEAYPIVLGEKAGASSANSLTIRPADGVKVVLANPTQTVYWEQAVDVAAGKVVAVPDASNIAVGYSLFGNGVVPATGTAFPKVEAINGNDLTLDIDVKGGNGTTLFVGLEKTQTILFNGADYVIIDGVSRNGATGLTIVNPNNINCQAIMIQNGSTYNVIKNCLVKGANVSGLHASNGGSGQIIFGGGENAYNAITNCDITDIDGNFMPICMVSFSPLGGANHHNTLENCNISNFNRTSATYMGNHNGVCFPSTWNALTHTNSILNNRFFWSKPLQPTSGGNFVPIGFGGSADGKGNRIEGNIIGYTSADGTGVAEINVGNFVGISVKYGSLKNNVVAGISGNFSSFTGIKNTDYDATLGVDDICTGNIVKDITIVAPGAVSTCIGLNVVCKADAGTHNLSYNEVSNISVSNIDKTKRIIVRPIQITGTASIDKDWNYIGNKVHDITLGDMDANSNHFVCAMDLLGNTGNVERNLIYGLNVVGVATQTGMSATGIRTSGSNVNGTTIRNNMICLGNGLDNDVSIYGIYQQPSYDMYDVYNVYNNTVYIGGAFFQGMGTKNTYVFYHTGLAAATDIRNNIFTNKRSLSGLESHVVYGVQAVADLAKCENNLLAFEGAVATIGTEYVADLAGWQGKGFGGNSFTADPLFVSPVSAVPDLHISNGSPAVEKGVSGLVVDDFDGQMRGTMMDLGADQISDILSSIGGSETSTLKFYPNPASDFVMFNGDVEAVSVYDFSGRCVLQIAQLVNRKMDVGSLTKGVYVLKVQTANGIQTAKMVVK